MAVKKKKENLNKKAKTDFLHDDDYEFDLKTKNDENIKEKSNFDGLTTDIEENIKEKQNKEKKDIDNSTELEDEKNEEINTSSNLDEAIEIDKEINEEINESSNLDDEDKKEKVNIFKNIKIPNLMLIISGFLGIEIGRASCRERV